MGDLFQFLKSDQEILLLIKACIFHYEIEFIHPFLDGNGRMGRFWQFLILTKYHPFLEFIPVESVIKDRQKEYYQTLENSDKKGDSTEFIEFSLKAILESLEALTTEIQPLPMTPDRRLELAHDHFNKIRIADVVYIYNEGGYAGPSTSMEIGFAVALGKPIYAYSVDEELCRQVLYRECVRNPEDMLTRLC
jgi:hypothetical protein